MSANPQGNTVRLGFTGLSSSSITAGGNDATKTQSLIDKILTAKAYAGNPAQITSITNHPHAYMTNALK